MVQLSYYPPAVTADLLRWEPAADDVHTLRHGYNLADLDRLTRMSIARVYGLTIDYRTRYELAWSMIAEALYAADSDSPPTPNDLVLAGQKAISQSVYDEMHHRGYDSNKGGGCMPKFAAYWEGMRRWVGPEAGVVERLALAQIWERLAPTHREALHALSVCEDYGAAAELLGKSYGTFASSISRARRAFLELWHEGEEPSRPWGFDRRSCHGSRRGSATNFLLRRERQRQGVTGVRRRITASQLADVRARREAGETLTEIAQELRFSKSYISRLLSGALRPAPDPA